MFYNYNLPHQCCGKKNYEIYCAFLTLLEGKFQKISNILDDDYHYNSVWKICTHIYIHTYIYIYIYIYYTYSLIFLSCKK